MTTKKSMLSMLIALNFISGAALAQTDLIYYALGGGNVLSAPARETHLAKKTVGIGWDMNLQCGNLNPSLTVKNQLNGVTEGFQDMMGSMLENATSAVMSLPGYFIQKQDPGLYDLLTNGVLEGKFDYDNGKTSCQEMTKSMGDSVASNKWTQMALGEVLTNAVKNGDAVEANKKSENSKGNDGLTWRGGRKAGGRGQPPIRITTDTAGAGFELLTAGQSQPKKEGLYRYWQTETELTEWLTATIGDVTAQTGSDKSHEGSQAGVGLSADVPKQAALIQQELALALEQGTPTESFPSSFIEALRDDPAKDIITPRLVSETALVQTIDKALLARRALIAGKQETYISQNQLAGENIDKAIAQLEQEIDMLRFEASVRREFSSNLIDEVIVRKQSRSQQMTPRTLKQPSSFEQGKFGGEQ